MTVEDRYNVHSLGTRPPQDLTTEQIATLQRSALSVLNDLGAAEASLDRFTDLASHLTAAAVHGAVQGVLSGASDVELDDDDDDVELPPFPFLGDPDIDTDEE